MSRQRSRLTCSNTILVGVTGLLTAGAFSCTESSDLGTDQQLVQLAPVEIEPIGPGPNGNDCPTTTTNVNQSLVVTAATHPGLTTRFTFARVMQQVFDTGGGAASQNKLSLYQAWMSTYAQPACSAPGIDPEGYDVQCPRTNEALLAAVDPYVATSTAPFTAVGLFNRFDLAPQTGETCGEHRIVFAVPQQPASNLDRAFIIFEAALPNPQPDLGIDGCYPVTRFWQSLSGLTTAARLDALEAFYFNGVVEPITGVFIGPVVTAQNYGLAVRPGILEPIDDIPGPSPVPVPVAETARAAGIEGLAAIGGRAMTDHVDRNGMILRYGGTSRFGQVRTNMFVNSNEWNLREFKLLSDCSGPARGCLLSFEHVPVAANPANELFLDTHANSPKFQDTFLQQVDALAAATDPNQIGLSTENVHNEFESVSFPDNLVVFSLPGRTSAAFRAAIQAELSPSTLTVNNILDRATTQTCAGCHLHSGGVNVGGFTWPQDAGFVHITETGFLSPALTGTFLPRRRQILDTFIAKRCDESMISTDPVDESRTVSGVPVGSSN